MMKLEKISCNCFQFITLTKELDPSQEIEPKSKY